MRAGVAVGVCLTWSEQSGSHSWRDGGLGSAAHRTTCEPGGIMEAWSGRQVEAAGVRAGRLREIVALDLRLKCSVRSIWVQGKRSGAR
ncbi:hypothetical protein NDU88_003863 [Pleurodeles waltl]|uniref:Uncharacterized protein n=1 Tax=Pleurodeles waltl TaxID=8319 RepID=A0AAV7LJP8_PLEWA|nr:hypothetical protein NDU88_003863 [Pleurodeles waltl]